MMHKEYSFNSDTWMLGCVFSVIASAARVSCFDFPKDPKFAHITERQRYGSPYSELIVRKVAHRPPDKKLYGYKFVELIAAMVNYDPSVRLEMLKVA